MQQRAAVDDAGTDNLVNDSGTDSPLHDAGLSDMFEILCETHAVCVDAVSNARGYGTVDGGAMSGAL